MTAQRDLCDPVHDSLVVAAARSTRSATRCPTPSLFCGSKYPPAEPEALRLLAPQRGLIATGEKQKQLQRHEAREATGFGKNEGNSGRYTPGILKVWLPPRQSRGNSHFIRKVFGVGVPRDGWFCRARVGDHFVGRFWRSPPPTTGRTHRNPSRFQVCAGGFATDPGGLLDPPQRPSQSPQS